jgi:hypothetical protein
MLPEVLQVVGQRLEGGQPPRIQHSDPSQVFPDLPGNRLQPAKQLAVRGLVVEPAQDEPFHLATELPRLRLVGEAIRRTRSWWSVNSTYHLADFRGSPSLSR